MASQDNKPLLVVIAPIPRCLYRGRPCYEPRDLKLNGKLHRYCRAHRLRHNQYQRESQERRRAERRAAQHELVGQALAQLEMTDAWLDSISSLFPEDDESAIDDAVFTDLHDAFLNQPSQALAPFTVDEVLMETGSIDDLLAFLPSNLDT